MSTGFSGNLGFGMPDNWAFDQFATITIGSGDGQIEIDKDGYSGRDPAVSKLNPITYNITSDDINIGNTSTDKITGPTVDILGHQVPLFELDVGLDANGLMELDTEYDAEDNTYKVLIGFNTGSMSTETTGSSTRIGKFNQAYREVKTTFSAIGKNNEEFSRRFKDLKGSLYQKGTKVGFDCSAYTFGYMTIDCTTGQLKEGGVAIVGTVESSISYMIVPCVYAKFAIEGSISSGFQLEKIESGEIDLKGVMEFGVKPKLGEQFDYTGMKVVAVYNNGQEFEIDSYTMTGFDSLSAGAKEITITYGDFIRKFAVTVAKKSVVKTDGSIKLDSVKGRLGETVEVPVTITKNTGVTAMCHTITFNPNTLKFVSATAKNGFANGTVVVNDEESANGEVTVLWFQATDVVESGVAYTLKFEILESAQDGNSSISIAFDENDNGNASGENVVFEAVNGGVEVLSYWLGDLDGDRKYGMADLLQLAQYVSGKEMTLTEKQKKSADVNEDGVIDVHDVTLLSQWLLTADM